VPKEALKDYTKIIRRERKTDRERRSEKEECRSALSMLLRNEIPKKYIVNKAKRN